MTCLLTNRAGFLMLEYVAFLLLTYHSIVLSNEINYVNRGISKL